MKPVFYSRIRNTKTKKEKAKKNIQISSKMHIKVKNTNYTPDP